MVDFEIGRGEGVVPGKKFLRLAYFNMLNYCKDINHVFSYNQDADNMYMF